MNCSTCGNTWDGGDLVNGLCPDCLGRSARPAQISDDALDQLVERASVPNLAGMYKRAKEQGFITPAPAYS